MSRGFGIRRHDPPVRTPSRKHPCQREDVVERQCRHDQKSINFRRRVDHRLIPRLDLQQVSYEISMEQHRAFRDACGAARILQKSEVIWSHSRRDEFQLAPGREHIVEFDAAGK